MRLSKWLLSHLLIDQAVRVKVLNDAVVELPSALEPLAYHLIINGEYESETSAFLMQHGHETDLFIDVGANVGYFSLMMKQAYPRLDVLAFEPSKSVFDCLKRNVEKNGQNVDIRNLVVCEEAGGLRDFYVAPAGNFGMSSMTNLFDGDRVEVGTESLDNITESLPLDHKVLLKVDVEGYEFPVLRGGEQLLQRTVAPTIVFEFCDWAEAGAGYPPGAAQELLFDSGYELWRLADYLRALPPLKGVLRQGADMLVAEKRSTADCLQHGV